MAKFIIFLNRIIWLYIYFVLLGCVLSWVPNINPDFPIFAYIFKFSGAYLLPPFMGLLFGPVVIVAICAYISQGLTKIYDKFYADKEPKIVVLTKDEFIKQFNNENSEEKSNDANDDTRSDS